MQSLHTASFQNRLDATKIHTYGERRETEYATRIGIVVYRLRYKMQMKHLDECDLFSLIY